MVIDAAAGAAAPAHVNDSGVTEATDRTPPADAENSLLQVGYGALHYTTLELLHYVGVI